MPQSLAEVMTPDPVTLPSDTTGSGRPRGRCDSGISAPCSCSTTEKLAGIVTDRDIVVRAVADRTDLSDCRLADLCSSEVVTAAPQDDIDTAVDKMRESAVRRVVVVEDGRPVGVFSLGMQPWRRTPIRCSAISAALRPIPDPAAC